MGVLYKGRCFENNVLFKGRPIYRTLFNSSGN
jgi:hypothetical protein